jgi:hypothetical protein
MILLDSISSDHDHICGINFGIFHLRDNPILLAQLGSLSTVELGFQMVETIMNTENQFETLQLKFCCYMYQF